MWPSRNSSHCEGAMERGRRIGRGAVSQTVAAWARSLDIMSSSFFCVSGHAVSVSAGV